MAIGDGGDMAVAVGIGDLCLSACPDASQVSQTQFISTKCNVGDNGIWVSDL